MRQIIISTLLVFSLTFNVNAQNQIAVQHVGISSFYTKLDSAIIHAQSGDTIYIPGGNYTINETISKCIHLVGVGHHPDSANVTARTVISGYPQLVLDNGADYGSVTGIFFNWPACGYNNCQNITILGTVTGYTISRCYLSGDIWANSPLSSNLSLTENIIHNIQSFATNISVNNNILLGTIFITNSSTLKNNVITFSSPGYNQYAFYGNGTDCIIENNIFKPGCTAIGPYGGSNIYHNNLNAGVNGIYNSNQGSGNFLDNILLQSIFVNYDPATDIYYDDFHLPVGSPYKNAGRDGTDIGIYGGAFPWKAGSIPFNPHFQSIQIGSTTNPSGNLNVNIKAAAQDH